MKAKPPRCPVLLYHSQNVAGTDRASNDHLALFSDLRLIHQLGLRIIPLSWLVEWVLGNREMDPAGCVCISFDDGVDADVHDLDFPGFGTQRSFLNIMLDFRHETGPGAQPNLHATSFVIASEKARSVMDRHSLFDQGWMNDDWWRAAHDNELLSIENHSWDHEHPDLVHIGGNPAGDFFGIDTREKADRQILAAGEYISSVCGGQWPRLFAYPYGQVSDYLCNEYFPGQVDAHIDAAFTTESQAVTADSDRWQLGRFVCGRDWRSGSDLQQILLS